jgi:uncharacterized cofD-like protein
MPRIVGIGGGTGLPMLLRGLKHFDEPGATPGVCVTAVVAVSDDGGSSGRLRRALRVPALGDLRNCLLALGEDGSLLSDLFEYRFSNVRGLSGHALGNLVLAALSQRTGSLQKAIDRVAHAMRASGTVLPATEVPVTLCAEGRARRRVRGECAITAARMRIGRLWLEPESPAPAAGVLECLAAADVIVLGPGSLFTSVIPPLLADGVAEAIRRSDALRIYVLNLMGEPGETDGFSAADHVRTLLDYLGEGAIDVCLLNTRQPRGRLAKRYLATGAQPIEPDLAAVQELGVVPVGAELLADEGPKARHEPIALGRLVLELAQARRARLRAAMTAAEEAGRTCVGSSAT